MSGDLGEEIRWTTSVVTLVSGRLRARVSPLELYPNIDFVADHSLWATVLEEKDCHRVSHLLLGDDTYQHSK